MGVDGHCHTGVDGVGAVGDCVRGPRLAHKGFEEGSAGAELIAGLPGHVNYDTIPNVIYTEPEVACVGRTEQQLKEDGTPYKTGSFPFAALGRAVAMAEPAGFVKVIAHAETDRVLGLHLVGVGVSEPVHERSEEHTSELTSLMPNSYAVFCFNNQTNKLHIYDIVHN